MIEFPPCCNKTCKIRRLCAKWTDDELVRAIWYLPSFTFCYWFELKGEYETLPSAK